LYQYIILQILSQAQIAGPNNLACFYLTFPYYLPKNGGLCVTERAAKYVFYLLVWLSPKSNFRTVSRPKHKTVSAG